MTDPTQDLLPEGLEDRLPQSAAAAARIQRAMLDVMRAHGYDRVRPPLIEFECRRLDPLVAMGSQNIERRAAHALRGRRCSRQTVTKPFGQKIAVGVRHACDISPLRQNASGIAVRTPGTLRIWSIA